jgi:flagellar motor switch protein FliM
MSASTATAATGTTATPERERVIHPCNFRYAGRLSNENARALTELHEKFALNVNNSLDVYLAATTHVKLLSLEQLSSQDYVAAMPAENYILPCALAPMESSFLMEMDIELIFPMIDLLLGGTGLATHESRELTEIDEEIMQSVMGLITTQIERSWRTLNQSLTPGHCIKPNLVQQTFPINEKLVLLMFEMTVAETTGSFKIALTTSFVGFLLRNLKAAPLKKASSLPAVPDPSFRERILDSDFTVAADITHMRVLVKDLVALKPGMVLKMKSPVKNPGRLTVEDAEIFEATPVRNGTMKAAQLLSRSQEPSGTKE